MSQADKVGCVIFYLVVAAMVVCLPKFLAYQDQVTARHIEATIGPKIAACEELGLRYYNPKFGRARCEDADLQPWRDSQ